MGQSLLSILLFGKEISPEKRARKEAFEKSCEDDKRRKQAIKQAKIKEEELILANEFVDKFLLNISEEIGKNKIVGIRGFNGELKIELKNNLQFDIEKLKRNLKNIKKAGIVNGNNKNIYISIGNYAEEIAEEIWNRVMNKRDKKIEENNNFINNQKETKTDVDKKIELLKQQQAILDRQIELEKLKERNTNRG